MERPDFGRGLHSAPGRPVDSSAYAGYVGDWSALFVPAVLAAAEVALGQRVLDVATGTGEAAGVALSVVETSGHVIGADVSHAMLRAAQARLRNPSFRPVAADGQQLPFNDESFDAVVCQLGLQFFPSPERGLAEFRRVLRPRRCAAVCVISTPDRAPVWGALADALSEHVPERREDLQLSFALADADRLRRMLETAGFDDVHVRRETRDRVIASFDDYWAPIEAGIGLMPQVYLALPESRRRAVRAEVRARLAQFESGGRLRLSVEMLIGSGRAQVR
jgi:ubiquinone/menaquinone biosynthesis C-methylase UbiE